MSEETPQSLLEDDYQTTKSLFEVRLRRIKITFFFTIFFLFMGMLFIAVGIFLIVIKASYGIIITATSAVFEILFLWILKLNNDENNRLENTKRELRYIARYIEERRKRDENLKLITNPKMRNRILKRIIEDSLKDLPKSTTFPNVTPPGIPSPRQGIWGHITRLFHL